MVHLWVKFIGNITVFAKEGNFLPLLYTSLLATLPALPTLPTPRKKLLLSKLWNFRGLNHLKNLLIDFWSFKKFHREFFFYKQGFPAAVFRK